LLLKGLGVAVNNGAAALLTIGTDTTLWAHDGPVVISSYDANRALIGLDTVSRLNLGSLSAAGAAVLDSQLIKGPLGDSKEIAIKLPELWKFENTDYKLKLFGGGNIVFDGGGEGSGAVSLKSNELVLGGTNAPLIMTLTSAATSVYAGEIHEPQNDYTGIILSGGQYTTAIPDALGTAVTLKGDGAVGELSLGNDAGMQTLTLGAYASGGGSDPGVPAVITFGREYNKLNFELPASGILGGNGTIKLDSNTLIGSGGIYGSAATVDWPGTAGGDPEGSGTLGAGGTGAVLRPGTYINTGSGWVRQ
jgi:hypothetical protein